jgi:hypothetical protein
VPLAIALLLIFGADIGGSLVDRYNSSFLWSSDRGPGYYAIRYRDEFGPFWSLFPVAAIVALATRWRPALFCTLVFSAAFVLHSFAGTRAERYLFYAVPFFATTWGIALTRIISNSNLLLRDFLSTRCRNIPVVTARSCGIAASLVALVLGWVVLMTPATELAVRMALDRPPYVPRYWFYYPTSWASARDTIADLVQQSDVFLTTQGHHAIYYIGDFDVEISASGLSDFSSVEGSSDIDPRTGRRVIADRRSLEAIINTTDSGLLVVDAASWRNKFGLNDDMADLVDSSMESVPVPREWGLSVFRWGSGPSGTRGVSPPISPPE